MIKHEIRDRYSVEAYCFNCDRGGTISPHLGVPVEQAKCPNCGCAYLELVLNETMSGD